MISGQSYSMFGSSENWPIITGIYTISGNYNGKNLVGQTQDDEGMYGRWHHHRGELRKDNHYNDYMQHSYNKHEEKDFSFVVLEICKPEELNFKEVFWIEKLDSTKDRNGWNLSNGGENGRRLSEETKNKIRIKATGRKHSEETLKKLSDIFVERRKCPKLEELRRKAIEEEKIKRVKAFENGEIFVFDNNTIKTIWSFMNRNGEIIHTTQLSLICNKYGLSCVHMSQVASGKRRFHKDWTSVINPYFPPIHKLINKDNIVYEFDSIKKFCKENKLREESISFVLKGKTKEYKGWRKYEN